MFNVVAHHMVRFYDNTLGHRLCKEMKSKRKYFLMVQLLVQHNSWKDHEVEQAMFGISHKKSQVQMDSPVAFIMNWNIVGDLVTKAVIESFTMGKLLAQHRENYHQSRCFAHNQRRFILETHILISSYPNAVSPFSARGKAKCPQKFAFQLNHSLLIIKIIKTFPTKMK